MTPAEPPTDAFAPPPGTTAVLRAIVPGAATPPGTPAFPPYEHGGVAAEHAVVEFPDAPPPPPATTRGASVVKSTSAVAPPPLPPALLDAAPTAASHTVNDWLGERKSVAVKVMPKPPFVALLLPPAPPLAPETRNVALQPEAGAIHAVLFARETESDVPLGSSEAAAEMGVGEGLGVHEGVPEGVPVPVCDSDALGVAESS